MYGSNWTSVFNLHFANSKQIDYLYCGQSPVWKKISFLTKPSRLPNTVFGWILSQTWWKKYFYQIYYQPQSLYIKQSHLIWQLRIISTFIPPGRTEICSRCGRALSFSPKPGGDFGVASATSNNLKHSRFIAQLLQNRVCPEICHLTMAVINITSLRQQFKLKILL